VVVVVVVLVDTGAALLQPPKSSSWVTVEVPHPSLFGCVCIVVAVVVVVCAGAGEAQASVLPQASMLEKPENVAAGAAAGGGAGLGAAGWDKLKAEFMGGEAIDWTGGWGAGAGAEGIERSRRSFMPEVEGAGCAGAEEKAEKLPRPLEDGFCAGGDFGFESKKFPPPPNMLDEADGGDLVLVKLSRPENGDGLGAGAAACPKDRLLNASFSPPKPDCCGCGDCWDGETRPPKES